MNKVNTVLIAGVVALVLFSSNQIAYAATFTVTKTADTADAVCDADCSLREAIIAANALSGADIVTLPAGTYTLTIPGTGEEAAATGDLDITEDLTINGAGATSTIIDGGGIDRVIQVDSIALFPTTQIDAVTIRNGNPGAELEVFYEGGGIANLNGHMTLTNSTITGNAVLSGGGGGIFNQQILTITNSTISGNTGLSTNTQGGGIYSSGEMAITNSTVSGNSAGGGGGMYGEGMLTITDSTISGNSAVGDGGGIFSFGEMTLTNSTITGNTTGDAGGGIFSLGEMTITNSTVSGNSSGNGGVNSFGAGGGIAAIDSMTVVNSTISGNSAGNGYSGGGIYVVNGPSTVENTIVANNGPSDCLGVITTLGHNLASDVSCAFGGAGDLNSTDPLLGPLSNNGGPTETHALLSGSPAIDAVPLASCTLSFDQRGISRPVGAACDIGAFEGVLNVNHPPVASAGPIQFVEATSPAGASVILDGSGSFDPDFDPLTYEWMGPFGTASGVSPTVTLPLGKSVVTLEVNDGQATSTESVTHEVRDTTPPDTAIISATDGAGAAVPNGASTLSTSMTFIFSGTDIVGVASLECSLDGTPFTPCTSPQNFAGLSLGSHTFQVQAVDTSLNTDSTPASYSWTVLTPAQAIQNLINTVNSMGLPNPVKLSLTAPLNGFNISNVPGTCLRLRVFIGVVNFWQARSQLTTAQAAQLRDAANAIKASLGC